MFLLRQTLFLLAAFASTSSARLSRSTTVINRFFGDEDGADYYNVDNSGQDGDGNGYFLADIEQKDYFYDDDDDADGDGDEEDEYAYYYWYDDGLDSDDDAYYYDDEFYNYLLGDAYDDALYEYGDEYVDNEDENGYGYEYGYDYDETELEKTIDDFLQNLMSDNSLNFVSKNAFSTDSSETPSESDRNSSRANPLEVMQRETEEQVAKLGEVAGRVIDSAWKEGKQAARVALKEGQKAMQEGLAKAHKTAEAVRGFVDETVKDSKVVMDLEAAEEVKERYQNGEKAFANGKEGVKEKYDAETKGDAVGKAGKGDGKSRLIEAPQTTKKADGGDGEAEGAKNGTKTVVEDDTGKLLKATA